MMLHQWVVYDVPAHPVLRALSGDDGLRYRRPVPVCRRCGVSMDTERFPGNVEDECPGATGTGDMRAHIVKRLNDLG